MCSSLRSLPVTHGSLFGGLASSSVEEKKRAEALRPKARQQTGKRQFASPFSPAQSAPPQKKQKQDFQRRRGGRGAYRGQGRQQPNKAALPSPPPQSQ